MARRKRNASQAGLDTATAATPIAKKGRRSNGRTVTETAAATRPRRSSTGNGDIGTHVTPKKRGRPPKAASAKAEPAKSQKSVGQQTSNTENFTEGSDTPAKATGARKAGTKGKVGRKSKASKTAAEEVVSHEPATQERRGSDFSVEIASGKAVRAAEGQDDEDEDEEGTSYWLMKAEPESRIEKGRDVKFSIDDLMNAKEPEGWDGEFRLFRVDA